MKETTDDLETPSNGDRLTEGSNRLSTISRKYDRGQKGWLDSKELRVREMHTEEGPAIDRVIAMLESLDHERRNNSNFKKLILLLIVFLVMVTLANIGTAFAAAKLAQDTDVLGHRLVNLNGQTIETAGTSYTFELSDADEEYDVRRMVETNSTDTNATATTDGNATVIFKLMHKDDAASIWQLFQDGADKVRLHHCKEGETYTSQTDLVTATHLLNYRGAKAGIYEYSYTSAYHTNIHIQCPPGLDYCSVFGLHACSHVPCEIGCFSSFVFCHEDKEFCTGCGCRDFDVRCEQECQSPLP